MQKKNLFSFHFRVHLTSPSLMARLLKVERKTKKLVSFFAEMIKWLTGAKEVADRC